MLEDGQEQGNLFRNNLGALTRRVGTIIPDNGLNGDETDDRPSTFWIANPNNSWEGNVAAGCQDNGFWFELRSSVRGPQKSLFPNLNPRKEPLVLFKNNVAHSNRNVSGLCLNCCLHGNPISQLTYFLCAAERNQNVPAWNGAAKGSDIYRL